MQNVTPPAPAKRALASLDEPATDTAAGRKRISKRVNAAIDLLVSGECKKIKEAAERVGLAREISFPRLEYHACRRAPAHHGSEVARHGRRARWRRQSRFARQRQRNRARSSIEFCARPGRHPARCHPVAQRQHRSESGICDRSELGARRVDRRKANADCFQRRTACHSRDDQRRITGQPSSPSGFPWLRHNTTPENPQTRQ